MKKLIKLLLVVLMALSLFACGGGGVPDFYKNEELRTAEEIHKIYGEPLYQDLENKVAFITGDLFLTEYYEVEFYGLNGSLTVWYYIDSTGTPVAAKYSWDYELKDHESFYDLEKEIDQIRKTMKKLAQTEEQKLLIDQYAPGDVEVRITNNMGTDYLFACDNNGLIYKPYEEGNNYYHTKTIYLYKAFNYWTW